MIIKRINLEEGGASFSGHVFFLTSFWCDKQHHGRSDDVFRGVSALLVAISTTAPCRLF